MTFVAEATRTLASLPEVAFDRLVDYASWYAWMPRSFRPVDRARGALRVGDRPRVRLAGALLPTTLAVSVVDRPREISWRGGVRPLLWGEHRFLFEADGAGGTRVRSVETFYGAAAPLVRPILQPFAVRIGGAQLAGLARSLRA